MLLIGAFAVVLLLNVSATMASNASPLHLVDGLRRDLGAVRAQLERADPAPFDTGRQSVASNADLGDGGSAFRHRSMATILRSAKRRLDNLATGYRNAGDTRRAAAAEGARRELQELSARVHDLGRASDAGSSAWARTRLEAEVLLERLQDRLVILLPPQEATSRNLG